MNPMFNPSIIKEPHYHAKSYNKELIDNTNMFRDGTFGEPFTITLEEFNTWQDK
jgi:hypothetical protein